MQADGPVVDGRRLRILHVLTYVSAVNAFGGPTSVAVVLAEECRRRGHSVALLAAADEETSRRHRWLGVPSLFFRSLRIAPLGFAGFLAPGAWAWFMRHTADFDVVHVHMARDLTTLPVAALAMARGRPLVLQTHGMVDPSERALSVPLDATLTRRVLTNADAVLYLTSLERRGLEAVAGAPLVRARRLTNGVPAQAEPTRPASSREILFMSRFEDRKRPDHLVRAAQQLLQEGHDLTFALVGADQGMLPEVLRLIEEFGIGDRVRYEGPLPPNQTLDRLKRARVLVLPSVREPYPMVILEAMSIGVPVVCTTECGLAERVDEYEAGIVIEPTVEALVEALRRCAADDALVEKLGANAYGAARGPFSVVEVVDDLLEVYATAIARHEVG